MQCSHGIHDTRYAIVNCFHASIHYEKMQRKRGSQTFINYLSKSKLYLLPNISGKKVHTESY